MDLLTVLSVELPTVPAALAGALTKLKSQHQEDPNSTVLAATKPALLRSLFTVGALCRHFDFDLEEFKGNSKVPSSGTSCVSLGALVQADVGQRGNPSG